MEELGKTMDEWFEKHNLTKEKGNVNDMQKKGRKPSRSWKPTAIMKCSGCNTSRTKRGVRKVAKMILSLP